MIDALQIEEAHAEAILEKAIEAEVYEGDMPESKKDKLEAAHDLVGFAVDSWIDDGVTPDSDDEEIAAAGEILAEIFEIAGVTIEDDEAVFGEPAELEPADDDDNDDDDADDDEDGEEIDLESMDLDALTELAEANDLDVDDIVGSSKGARAEKKLRAALEELDEILLPDDDDADDSDDDDEDEAGEAPFEINDIIEDYEDIKKGPEAVEAIEEAIEGDGLYREQVEALLEYENERSRPRKVVVELLESLLEGDDNGADDDEDPDAAGDDDDDADGDDEADETEEPWDGFDTAPVKDIKEVLNDEERTVEELQYVVEYEGGKEKPRKTVISTAEKRIAELSEGGDDDDDDEPEEKPKRTAGRRASSRAKAKQDELDDETDDAVARDDEKEARKSRRSSSKKKDTSGDFDPDDDEIAEMLPAGLARSFVNDRLHEAEVAKAGLTPPPDWEGDMPELPEDVAATDHDELSNLLFEFQAAFSTALWQSSMAYIDADVYDEIADYLENLAIMDSEESNDTKRKADAKTDERVVVLRAKSKSSYRTYVRYRDLAKTIEGKIKVVSRVGGFKSDDEDGESRVATKKSTRGAAKGTGRRLKS